MTLHAPRPLLAVPVRRLRATLRAVVRAVQEDQARVVLTRHGRPVAALVPVGALDALDLLEQLLPDAPALAAGLRDPDPGAPGLGPAPEAGGGPDLGGPRPRTALRSRLSVALGSAMGPESPAVPPPPEAR